MRNFNTITFAFLLAFLSVKTAAISTAMATPFPVSSYQSNTAPNKHQNLLHKVAILGTDDRISLPEKYTKSAAAVGILTQPGNHGWSCTAFCVAPNIIATNAHCLVQNAQIGNKLNLSKILFVLPKFKNTFGNGKYQNRISYPEYIDPKQPYLSVYSGNFIKAKPVNSQSQDWAFTKLIHSVCKNRSLPFANNSISEIQKAANNKKLYMIGYHGDKQMQERLFSSNCKIRSPKDPKFFLSAQRRSMKKQNLLLPHTCDAYKGSSGSPILQDTKDGPKVVGINLGSLRYERYRIKKNRYTGKIISRRKIKSGKETNMAIMPRAFMAGISRFSKEQLLNNVLEFRQIQQALKTLKLYKGPIDGKLGTGSRKALLAYEKQKQLIPLGVPTQELLALLLEETKNSPDKSIYIKTINADDNIHLKSIKQ